MILLIGNLRAGIVSMVPNLVPIALTLALMVVVGITLDMFTLMVGCIAIGLAVDDSIHLIAGFRRYLARTGDAVEAVDLTLRSTGRAILFTTIVLTLGFGVFLFSSMKNLQAFGLLTGFAIAAAFVLDVLATPALLVLLFRHPVEEQR
jgi:predicted RND superfamily exporter protein